MLSTMFTRRVFLATAGSLLAIGALPLRAQRLTHAMVHMSPSCGCCGGWVKHLEANGFRVQRHYVSDVSPVKVKLGVPESLWSCHTALIEGYAIEGHVPAADIRRLLRERPTALGLAVPGMPIGSPGMEQGAPEPYASVLFDARGSRVFARH